MHFIVLLEGGRGKYMSIHMRGSMACMPRLLKYSNSGHMKI